MGDQVNESGAGRQNPPDAAPRLLDAALSGRSEPLEPGFALSGDRFAAGIQKNQNGASLAVADMKDGSSVEVVKTYQGVQFGLNKGGNELKFQPEASSLDLSLHNDKFAPRLDFKKEGSEYVLDLNGLPKEGRLKLTRVQEGLRVDVENLPAGASLSVDNNPLGTAVEFKSPIDLSLLAGDSFQARFTADGQLRIGTRPKAEEPGLLNTADAAVILNNPNLDAAVLFNDGDGLLRLHADDKVTQLTGTYGDEASTVQAAGHIEGPPLTRIAEDPRASFESTTAAGDLRLQPVPEADLRLSVVKERQEPPRLFATVERRLGPEQSYRMGTDGKVLNAQVEAGPLTLDASLQNPNRPDYKVGVGYLKPFNAGVWQGNVGIKADYEHRAGEKDDVYTAGAQIEIMPRSNKRR